MASHRLCADNGVVGCWIRSMVQDSPRVYLGKRGLGAAWFVGRGARDVLLLLLTITSVGVSERRYPARTPPARCNVLALPRRMPPNQAQALMRLAGGSTMDDADGVEEHADGVEEEESDELPNLVEQDFDKLLREYEEKVEALRQRGSRAPDSKGQGGDGDTNQAEAGEAGGDISELEEELQERLATQLAAPREGSEPESASASAAQDPIEAMERLARGENLPKPSSSRPKPAQPRARVPRAPDPPPPSTFRPAARAGARGAGGGEGERDQRADAWAGVGGDEEREERQSKPNAQQTYLLEEMTRELEETIAFFKTPLVAEQVTTTLYESLASGKIPRDNPDLPLPPAPDVREERFRDLQRALAKQRGGPALIESLLSAEHDGDVAGHACKRCDWVEDKMTKRLNVASQKAARRGTDPSVEMLSSEEASTDEEELSEEPDVLFPSCVMRDRVEHDVRYFLPPNFKTGHPGRNYGYTFPVSAMETMGPWHLRKGSREREQDLVVPDHLPSLQQGTSLPHRRLFNEYDYWMGYAKAPIIPRSNNSHVHVAGMSMTKVWGQWKLREGSDGSFECISLLVEAGPGGLRKDARFPFGTFGPFPDYYSPALRNMVGPCGRHPDGRVLQIAPLSDKNIAVVTIQSGPWHFRHCEIRTAGGVALLGERWCEVTLDKCVVGVTV
ncbi:hypothetical protein T484DRAFT_1851795 [Baffinella frigidus]|nr:hypothetical protein T484DRAFT_1851795 [Cryptophyta sp. CCMP2293]